MTARIQPCYTLVAALVATPSEALLLATVTSEMVASGTVTTADILVGRTLEEVIHRQGASVQRCVPAIF